MLILSVDSSGAPLIKQKNIPPTVYFDHWALMELSKNQELIQRFLKSLKNRNGTLALSWLNLLEYSKIKDKNQITDFETFMDQISPRLFFINSDPWEVVASEDKVVSGERQFSAWGDKELLKYFITMDKPTNSLNPLDAKCLLKNINIPELQNHLKILGNVFVEQVNLLKSEYNENEKLKKMVNKSPRASSILPATRFLIPELIGFFLKNEKKKLGINDGIDFFHAVVPLSYCNYVLLDGHWADQANKVNQRLLKAGQKEPVAKAFSGRKDGLQKFISFFISHN